MERELIQVTVSVRIDGYSWCVTKVEAYSTY